MELIRTKPRLTQTQEGRRAGKDVKAQTRVFRGLRPRRSAASKISLEIRTDVFCRRANVASEQSAQDDPPVREELRAEQQCPQASSLRPGRGHLMDYTSKRSARTSSKSNISKNKNQEFGRNIFLIICLGYYIVPITLIFSAQTY